MWKLDSDPEHTSVLSKCPKSVEAYLKSPTTLIACQGGFTNDWIMGMITNAATLKIYV